VGIMMWKDVLHLLKTYMSGLPSANVTDEPSHWTFGMPMVAGLVPLQLFLYESGSVSVESAFYPNCSLAA
jgi:hypothetical protein